LDATTPKIDQVMQLSPPLLRTALPFRPQTRRAAPRGRPHTTAPHANFNAFKPPIFVFSLFSVFLMDKIYQSSNSQKAVWNSGTCKKIF